jgi:hypothetical protein
MSKGRYFSAIAAVILSVVLFCFIDDEIWVRLLVGFGVGFSIAELIFGEESFPARAFLFFLNVIKEIFFFWLIFFTRGLVGIILALVLASLIGSAIGAVFTVGVGALAILSPVFFIIHLISFASDLE